MKRSSGRNRGPSPPREALPLPRSTAALLARGPREGDHLGLWLDRFLPRDAQDGSFKGDRRVAQLQRYARPWTAPAAALALARRAEGFAVFGPGGTPTGGGPPLLRMKARLLGKLLIDHGRASATEMSVSFHPIWGAPRISGSALKGVAAAEAESQGLAPELRERLFGSQALCGAVCFTDAVPEDGRFALALDTLTPHMGPWYRKETHEGRLLGPVEWTSPVPFSFLAVAEATFVLDLTIRPGVATEEGVALLRQAGELLSEALVFQGAGAKTAAGYGRFSVEG